jgi:hypothetical protein
MLIDLPIIEAGDDIYSFSSLLEKRCIVTPIIYFWYELIIVADTKNKSLFFMSAVFSNRYKKIVGD